MRAPTTSDAVAPSVVAAYASGKTIRRYEPKISARHARMESRAIKRGRRTDDDGDGMMRADKEWTYWHDRRNAYEHRFSADELAREFEQPEIQEALFGAADARAYMSAQRARPTRRSTSRARCHARRPRLARRTRSPSKSSEDGEPPSRRPTLGQGVVVRRWP